MSFRLSWHVGGSPRLSIGLPITLTIPLTEPPDLPLPRLPFLYPHPLLSLPEKVGFEPTDLWGLWFSRPTRSTTLASLLPFGIHGLAALATLSYFFTPSLRPPILSNPLPH